MKKLITLTMAVMLTAASLNAQDKKAEAEPQPIGLSFSMDYYSLYLWRGTNWFGGDGAYLPKIAYNIANTGLIVSVIGELPISALSGGMPNTTSFYRQGVDFGLDYSLALGKYVNLNMGLLYSLYPISTRGVDAKDVSFLTATVGVSFNVPLKPSISYTHDFYFMDPTYRYTDFYIKVGIAHDFEIVKSTFTLTPGVSMGLFNSQTNTISTTRTSFAVSDITISVMGSVKAGGATFTAGLLYTIVPTTVFETFPSGTGSLQLHYNRFGAQLNASYSL